MNQTETENSQQTAISPTSREALFTSELKSGVDVLLKEMAEKSDGRKQPRNWVARYFDELFPKADDWPNVGLDIWRRQTLVQSLAVDLKNFLSRHQPQPQVAKSVTPAAGEQKTDGEAGTAREEAQSPNYLALAATDLFVEKAQLKLTRRARMNMIAGTVIAIIALLTLAIGSYVIYSQSPIDYFYYLNNKTLTLAVMRAAALSAFFLTAVVFMVGLARAFFHEGTILYNRRHAIRFGRLFVYMNNGNVTLDDLEKAFSWNSETVTAFKDIKPELLSKTLWHKILESPAEILQALTGGGRKSAKADDKDKQ